MTLPFNKRIVSALLCLALLVITLPGRVYAAGLIDTEREVSLTVTFRSEGEALAELPFDLYLVATVAPNGELQVTEDFARFPVDIRGENDEAWRALATTLEGYVLSGAVAPADSGITDENGQVRFPSQTETLAQGLYFIPGFRYVQGEFIYEAQPFLVLLPGLDEKENQWVYDLTVQPKYIQPDDLPMVRKVIKVWDDNDSTQRPTEVTVQLLRNGEVYETVVLSAANDWRHTWAGLSAHDHWTVSEQVPDGYTVEITKEGITFVVINTADTPTTPPPPSLPQTGQLWWPVPLLTAGGLLLIVIGLLRRRGEQA